MKRRRKSYPTIQFGTSLMLVVFIILCLTAFATLSLSSAMRDYEYSKKAADKTSAYYKADAKASRRLAEIAQVLDNLSQSYLASEDAVKETAPYMEQALLVLQEEVEFDLTVQTDSDRPQITYRVPVTDSQILQVTLALNVPGASDGRLYQIVQWKETASKEWNNKTALPVMGSD